MEMHVLSMPGRRPTSQPVDIAEVVGQDDLRSAMDAPTREPMVRSPETPSSEVVYLPSATGPQGPRGSTVLIRILRRTVEQEKLRAQDALALAIKLKKSNLTLKRQLDESETRVAQLERQLERLKKTSKRVSFDARIDQLAARLVRGETT